MTFDEVKALMAARGSMEVGEGAKEAEVADAERVLGVEIRGDYRRFLLELGWGGVAGIELFGLGSDVPHYLDLVRVTQSERTHAHPHMPRELIPVMNNGAGDHYCLDSTTAGPQVVGWWHEEGETQTPTIEAEDFSTWLAAEIKSLA